MSKESMKLALEALEMVDRDDNDRDFLFPNQCYQLDEAITALREALAEQQTDWEAVAADQALTIALLKAKQPAQQQEPVAWMVYTLDGKSVYVTDNPADFTVEHRSLPLYTSPQPAQRKPLTDEEIEAMSNDFEEGYVFLYRSFARAIEAAHGIKENT